MLEGESGCVCASRTLTWEARPMRPARLGPGKQHQVGLVGGGRSHQDPDGASREERRIRPSVTCRRRVKGYPGGSTSDLATQMTARRAVQVAGVGG